MLGLGLVLQTMPCASTAEPPLLTSTPPELAVFLVILLTLVVVMFGMEPALGLLGAGVFVELSPFLQLLKPIMANKAIPNKTLITV